MNSFEKSFFWGLFFVMITAAVVMFQICSEEPPVLLQPAGDVLVKTLNTANLDGQI